jgi:2-desacetyl-2-hydroxyethyl bacteriochlorophyllide A dehydrogenase
MLRPVAGEGVAGTGRAVWFSAPRTVEVRTQDVPHPGPGEVMVQGRCSLISPGTEMLVYRGQIRPDQPTGVATVEGSFGFPIKYGYQVVGTVVEAGPGTSVEPGQLVFCRHPHQTLFTMPEGVGLVTPIPPQVDQNAAAFANLLDTSLNCLFDVPVRFGDVVVVFGLGIVGLFCAQLAARITDTVVAVDPLAERRTRALDLGLPHAVSPEAALELVRELSGGRLADISIEASGTGAGLQSAILATGQEGTIGVVAFYGTKSLEITPGDAFHVRRQRIVSSWVVQVGSGLQPRWDRARRFATAMRLAPSMNVGAMVTHRVTLEGVAEAYARIDAGDPATFGVILDLSAG